MKPQVIATIPEIPDELLEVLDLHPAVSATQRAYSCALRVARLLAAGDLVLSQALLDIDAAVGDKTIAAIGVAYGTGLMVAS